MRGLFIIYFSAKGEGVRKGQSAVRRISVITRERMLVEAVHSLACLAEFALRMLVQTL